jgi:hypothetical protein
MINTGQMLFVLGALLLFTSVAMTVNSTLLNTRMAMLHNEAGLTATSIATTMIDEIVIHSYDSATVGPGSSRDGKVIPDSSKCTPPGLLGPEGSEAAAVPLPEPPDTASPYKSSLYYNDVDDYNLYRRYVQTSMGTFAVIDSVFYVVEASPDQRSAIQTFYKKVVVTVRHRNLTPTGQYQAYQPWQGPYYVQLSHLAIYRRNF